MEILLNGEARSLPVGATVLDLLTTILNGPDGKERTEDDVTSWNVK